MADDTANAVPNPGTEEAIAKGCRCPIIDNHFGRGVPSRDGRLFYYTASCPVHSPSSPTDAARGAHDHDR